MDQTDSAPEKSRVIGVLVIVAGAFGASLFRMPPDQANPLDGTTRTGPGRESGLAVRVAESTGQGNDVVLRDSSSLPPADIGAVTRPEHTREAARESVREFGSRPRAAAPPSMPAEYGRLGQTRPDDTARAELRTPAAMTPKKREAKRRSEHRVRDGDTLESIARRYYDDERRADDIFDVNRNLLPSRNLLPLNVMIKLPALESLKPISERKSSGAAPPTGPQTRTTLGSVR